MKYNHLVKTSANSKAQNIPSTVVQRVDTEINKPKISSRPRRKIIERGVSEDSNFIPQVKSRPRKKILKEREEDHRNNVNPTKGTRSNAKPSTYGKYSSNEYKAEIDEQQDRSFFSRNIPGFKAKNKLNELKSNMEVLEGVKKTKDISLKDTAKFALQDKYQEIKNNPEFNLPYIGAGLKARNEYYAIDKEAKKHQTDLEDQKGMSLVRKMAKQDYLENKSLNQKLVIAKGVYNTSKNFLPSIATKGLSAIEAGYEGGKWLNNKIQSSRDKSGFAKITKEVERGFKGGNNPSMMNFGHYIDKMNQRNIFLKNGEQAIKSYVNHNPEIKDTILEKDNHRYGELNRGIDRQVENHILAHKLAHRLKIE